MNTAALPDASLFLLSMATAIDPTEPQIPIVGKTTISDIERNYLIIDTIGTCYTGGPVLNLSAWELGLGGLGDIQLAFDGTGVLDVVTVKVEKTHLEAVIAGLRQNLITTHDESSTDFLTITFQAGSTEVTIDSHPMDSHFTVNYLSSAFKHARSEAHRLYA